MRGGPPGCGIPRFAGEQLSHQSHISVSEMAVPSSSSASKKLEKLV